MEKPRLTWPLLATLALCLFSLIVILLQIVLMQPAMLLMLKTIEGGTLGERLLGLSPLIALYLFGAFAWFCLVRIFLRRSCQTARLFLLVLALLLAVAFPFAWNELGVESLWLALWFALVVALFFAQG
jgi:hypothetical protein